MLEALHTNAPLLVNAVIVVLSALACFLWVLRRQDMMFAWVGFSGVLWILYNLQFMLAGNGLLHMLGLAALYLQPIAMIGFVASDCDPATRQRLLRLATLTFVGTGILHAILEALGVMPAVLMAMFIAVAGSFVIVVRHYKPTKAKSLDLAILAAAGVSLAGASHDALDQADLWPGFGLPALPMAGLAAVTILTFVLGQRVLQALSVEENVNVMLEDRMRAANASLMASEAARRALEVSGAIAKERDRLMREIHDGIGSSLISAIAASENQGRTSDPEGVLKRALTDLRIAVDSLEPVQGDVATLLASLRYRVEPDFKKAGIAFDWQVDLVPELNWLDPANALQILRIFQEAFGNIAAHSGATKIVVRCHPMTKDGRTGIVIVVKDNGRGFVVTGGPHGHGLRNMRRRAETIGADFDMVSEPGKGTTVSVWLPDER